jgi:hypothetical protein
MLNSHESNEQKHYPLLHEGRNLAGHKGHLEIDEALLKVRLQATMRC